MTIQVYTYIYRPPEILMLNTDYTDKADIWALGVTLVEYSHFLLHPWKILYIIEDY
jgi:serine/threonine protein kinase